MKDRWGVRRLALPGVILTTLAIAALGCADGLVAQWMILWAAFGLTSLLVKGEHGSTVVYANRITRTETTDKGEDVEREIPFLKAYTVFNVDQVEGLPPLGLQAGHRADDGGRPPLAYRRIRQPVKLAFELVLLKLEISLGVAGVSGPGELAPIAKAHLYPGLQPLRACSDGHSIAQAHEVRAVASVNKASDPVSSPAPGWRRNEWSWMQSPHNWSRHKDRLSRASDRHGEAK